MRRLIPALLSLVLLAGCGPSPKELEPEVRDTLRDFARAVVNKDNDRINGYVLPTAGQRSNPVGAKDLDTPEGREKIIEGNRRWIRSTFKDAGILAESDVDVFMQALRIGISGKDAMVTFEIAAEGRRAAEIVTLRLTKTDKGWRIFDYDREFKMGR